VNSRKISIACGRRPGEGRHISIGGRRIPRRRAAARSADGRPGVRPARPVRPVLRWPAVIMRWNWFSSGSRRSVRVDSRLQVSASGGDDAHRRL